MIALHASLVAVLLAPADDATPKVAGEAPASTPSASAPSPDPAIAPATAGPAAGPAAGEGDATAAAPPDTGAAPARPPRADADALAPISPIPATPPSTSGQHTAPPPAKKTRPDRPIRWRVSLLGGAASTTIYSPSYLAFDEDRTLWSATLGARFDVPVARGRVFVGGGIRWQRGTTSRGSILGDFDTELRLDEPEVNGRVSVVTVEGLDVFADVGAGPSVRRYEVRSTLQAPSDIQVGGTGAAAGGVSLYLPKVWLPRKGASRVTGGVELSLGYRYRSAVPVTVNVQDDDDPITVGDTDLGDARMSGLQFAISVFVRLM